MTVEPWRTLKREVVFERRHLRVAQDRVQLPNGEQTDYWVLLAGQGIAVLAMDGDEVVLVRQYRHPIGVVELELPGGGVHRGETPEEAARRELREETGLEVGPLRELTSFYPSASRATTLVHVFMGEVVSRAEARLETQEYLEVERVPLERALEMVVDGDIREVTTAFALLMYDHLRRKDAVKPCG